MTMCFKDALIQQRGADKFLIISSIISKLPINEEKQLMRKCPCDGKMLFSTGEICNNLYKSSSQEY